MTDTLIRLNKLASDLNKLSISSTKMTPDIVRNTLLKKFPKSTKTNTPGAVGVILRELFIEDDIQEVRKEIQRMGFVETPSINVRGGSGFKLNDITVKISISQEPQAKVYVQIFTPKPQKGYNPHST